MGIFDTTEKVLTHIGSDVTAFIEFAAARNKGWGTKADAYVAAQKAKYESKPDRCSCKEGQCNCSHATAEQVPTTPTDVK